MFSQVKEFHAGQSSFTSNPKGGQIQRFYCASAAGAAAGAGAGADGGVC